MDSRTVAIVLALLIAPVPLCLMVAMLRGYTVELRMYRPNGGRKE